MWGFMTTGTARFLIQLADKHPDIPFHFMRSGTSTLAYYENDKKKSLFVSGRTYEIIYEHSMLQPKGYVVMEHIPVVDDGKDVFEERVKQFLPKLTQAHGLQTIRLLRPIKQEAYCVITQWKSEEAYDLFIHSPMQDLYEDAKLARHPAYFANRPFTSTYIMLTDEDS